MSLFDHGVSFMNSMRTTMLPVMLEDGGSDPQSGQVELRLDQAQLAVDRAVLRAEKAEQRAEAAEARLALEEEADLRLRKYSQFQLWLRVLDAARWAPLVVAAWVPLQALQPIARDFAGKDTRFDGSLKISIIFSLVVSVGWAATAARSAVRKRKIKTQRNR